MARALNSDSSDVAMLHTLSTPGSTTPSSGLVSVTGDSISSSDVHTDVLDVDLSLEAETTQTYLSAMWCGGKLGAAYYDVETTQIHMMLDTVETDDFGLLRKLRQQIQPMCVLLSAAQDERVTQALKHKGVDPEEDLEADTSIQVLPSIDFSLDVCKRRLLALQLPGMPEHFTDSERSIYMSSVVPFENINMVRAIGGLLKFLDKKRIGIELEAIDARVPVLAMQTFSMEDLMIVDNNTYSALQIFNRKRHPSARSTSSRESFSLFNQLNGCLSHTGSKLLRLWFLRPLKNLAQLQERLQGVAYFANPRNLEITSSLQGSLKHIKTLPRILNRMSRAQALLTDWQALYKTVYNAICIADVCRAQRMSIPIFHKIGEKFTEALPKIANLICKIVDFDESAVLNRFVVKPQVDPELDQMKGRYNSLPELMTSVAREELSKLSEDIRTCNVVYLPQLGYLLAVPLQPGMVETEKYDLPGLSFVFHSNQMAHYRTAGTMELDRQLGDIQCNITDRETAIMHRLQTTILEHTQTLLDVMTLTAELDCLAALGAAAKASNYIQPELTTAKVLHIKDGRHPLQELCCSPFVPNDTQSGAEHGRMKILTGPNASGKSVYLKQVALIVFMAHIGSFVPAEAAVIGLADRIFTRIRTMENVSVGLSTFMIDLNQVSRAVNCATDRSLVILDEFGKGTSTTDGVSLLCATLKHWLDMKDACPHTFVSTHFHSVVLKDLLPVSPQLKYMTMEVIHEGEELVFLYQLVEGSTNSSYACHVAAQTGVPQEIVSRAAEVSELLRQNQPVNAVTADTSEQMQQRCQTVVDRFLELDLDNDDVEDFLQNFVVPVMTSK